MRCPLCTTDAGDELACPSCGHQLRMRSTLPRWPRRDASGFEGRTIAGYQLGQRIGAGMTTTVLGAIERSTANPVVVEIVHPELLFEPGFRERFVATVERAREVRNDHLVAIHAHGEIEGLVYVVRERMRDAQLDRVISEGPLPWQRALAIVRQLCGALASLHAAGVFTRHLSTNEVYIASRPGPPSGDPYRGLASATVDFARLEPISGMAVLSPRPDNTIPVARLGRYEAMAPELLDAKQPDARSHVYSLGLLAYEMLTGRHPFYDCDGPAQMVLVRMARRIEPPSRRADVPASVDDVVVKCLAVAARDRYPDVTVLADELGALLTASPSTSSTC